MKKQLVDRKNLLTYLFWSWVNKTILWRQFKQIKVVGGEQLPPNQQPFMIVSNHISRWDGLLIYQMLCRPSNFMVSPNELVGFQGRVLQSMGAFPASARFDLKNHVQQQIAKGEPVVIFPEGDIHRDGTTHPFKSGAARFALSCAESGVDLPIFPVAITYGADGHTAEIAIGLANTWPKAATARLFVPAR